METPILYQGGVGVDDRGEISFVNEFNFQGVKRFYLVQNYSVGFIRAWHAHQKEAKYITVVGGAALIGAVAIDNFVNPSRTAERFRFVLSSKKPAVIYIPKGYANGAMTLTADAKIIYFSTSTLEESKGDDYRYDPYLWDIWKIEQR